MSNGLSAVEGVTRSAVVDKADAAEADARQSRFRIDGAMPSQVGMRFSAVLPFDSWVQIGRRVAMHSNASTWWLGDWLVYGKYKYGRRYKMGVAATGLDYQTLRNYAVVARRFEPSRRRDKLTFQHHAEVCALPDEEQDEWLDRAEQKCWSRNELRRHLQAARGSTTALVPRMLRLAVDPERESQWREAAARSSAQLDAWIVSTLDAAASSALRGT